MVFNFDIYSKYLITVEYTFLPVPVTILTMIGAWCPRNWSNKWKTLYILYSLFILGNACLFGLQMIIYFGVSIYNRAVDFNTLFAFTALCNGMTKLLTLLFDRSWLMTIFNLAFAERLCKPRDKVERKIVEDHEKNIRKIQIGYGVTVFVALCVKLLLPIYHILVDSSSFDPQVKLAVPAWYPFNLQDNSNLIWALVQQAFGGYIVAFSNVGTDLLLSDLMLQICLLLKLLRNRIVNVKQPNFYESLSPTKMDRLHFDMKQIAIIAKDHQLILNFADSINENFTMWLIMLISTGAPNLFMNFYLMTSPNRKMVEKLSPITLLFLCFVQISLVCWSGNEVTLHSIDINDAIYEGGWPDVQSCAKKSFIMIMGRSYHRPIVLSIANFIPLNLDSLISIIKTAYTAINVLKQVND